MRHRLILIVILAACVASWCAPELAALDRRALAAGQLWRLWTGHLVHWNSAQLLWNGLTFAVLGWLLAGLAPRAFACLLGLGSPLVAGLVLLLHPGLRLYGGLSGLDVALWLVVCATVAVRSRDRVTGIAAWLALGGGLLKVAFELATGHAVLVAGVTMVPGAHLAGVLVGLGLIAFELWPRRKPVGVCCEVPAHEEG